MYEISLSDPNLIFWVWEVIYNIKIVFSLSLSAFSLIFILQNQPFRSMRNYFILLIHFAITGYYFSHHLLFFTFGTLQVVDKELLMITSIIPMFFILLVIIGMINTALIDTTYYFRGTIIISTLLCTSVTLLLIGSILSFLGYGFSNNLASKSISSLGISIIFIIGGLASFFLILGCLFSPLRKQMFPYNARFMFFYRNYRLYGLAILLLSLGAITELGSVERILDSDFLMILGIIGNFIAIFGLYLILLSVFRTRSKLQDDITSMIKEQYEELKLFRDSLAEKVKNANRDLFKEKKRIETVVETIPDGIIVFDVDRNVYIVNKVFRTFYEMIYNRKLPISLKDFPLLGQSFGETIAKLIYSQKEIVTTIEPQKGLFLQLASSQVMINPNNPLGVVISVRDVTPFVELDQLRKQFVSVVSHELRTPITAIDLSITNLQKYRKKLSEEQQEEIIGMITESSSLLNQMIEDLLIVSRIESGQFKLQPRTYNLWEVLNEVLLQMEPKRQAQKISFHTNIVPEIELFGDPKRISQVFRILVDNAIKYSQENSITTISTIDKYQGKYNKKNIEGALILVSDTGLGISEMDLHYLFKRFYRSQEVKEIPGTGLGLSIAKELVLLHQGDIFVESIYSKGSTFFVFLPRLEKLEK